MDVIVKGKCAGPSLRSFRNMAQFGASGSGEQKRLQGSV